MDGMAEFSLPFVAHIDEERDLSQGVFDYEEAGKPRSGFAQGLFSDYEALVAGGKATNLKTAIAGRRNLYMVNPYLLYIDKELNSRNLKSERNQRHIMGLAESIKERGVLTPLVVQNIDGRYLVVDGHCRFLAIMHALNVLGAEIKSVPILTDDNKMQSEADRLALQFVRNSGIGLDPMEAAFCVARMKGHGWTEAQIATKTGLSASRVKQLLDLHNGVTPVVMEMIEKEEVTTTTVLGVIKETGSADRTQALLTEAKDLVEENGGSRIMPKHIREVQEKHATAANADAPASREEALTDIAAQVQTKDAPADAGVKTTPATTKEPASKPLKATSANREEPVSSPVEIDADDALAEIKAILGKALTLSGDEDVNLILNKAAYDRIMLLVG